MLRVLDLFSGIGGFSLGLERTGGFKTVAFCEIDPFCRAVLAKHWPDVPINDDIRTWGGVECDLISAGYPCQPESLAGKRMGKEDDRWLWPETIRLLRLRRPAWFIGENVAGHITMGLDQVLFDLEELGYACRSFVIPAIAINAKHRRDRVWIVANTNGIGLQEREHVAVARGEAKGGKYARRAPDGIPAPADASDAKRWERSLGRQVGRMGWFDKPVSWDGDWQAASEPVLDRGDDGIPNRLDRLRSLGNAVVPQIPEIIGRAILAAEAEA